MLILAITDQSLHVEPVPYRIDPDGRRRGCAEGSSSRGDGEEEIEQQAAWREAEEGYHARIRLIAVVVVAGSVLIIRYVAQDTLNSWLQS